MSDITVVHLDHTGTVINTFRPEELQFTLRKGVDGPHDITYALSRDQAVDDMVGAYRTDFQLIDSSSSLGAYTIMAGMHTSAPQVTTDEERLQIAGKDWMHYFERRYWPYDDTNPSAYRIKPGGVAATINDPPTGYAYYIDASSTPRDSMGIITDILNMVLGQTNSLAITYSLANIGYTPQNFVVTLIDTENVLSKIQTLSQEDNGKFDFWIESDKSLHRAAPHRYTTGVESNSALAEQIFDTSVPASGVVAVNYENIGPVATRLIGQGANQSSTIVSVREYAPGSAQFRLLEDHVSFEGVLSNLRVRNLTRRVLLNGLNPVHNVSITVIPDALANFWSRFHPGVAIWLTCELEAHLIDAAFEIISIDGSSDDDGNMVAVFNLQQIYTDVSVPL
jgi:hypothetical protein